MNTFKTFLFVLLASLSTLASANDGIVGSNCPPSQLLTGNLMVNHFFTYSMGCLVQVTPIDKNGLVYREYVFDERGRFLVYDSIAGPDDTSTAYRSFFLFPRMQVPEYSQEADGTLNVTMSTGMTIQIDVPTMRMKSLPGSDFEQASDITIAPWANAKISKYSGVVLDAGWMLGKAAYRDFSQSSTFIDGNGQRCEVRNLEIFDYQEAIYQEPLLMFQTDEKLKEFLNLRCPMIDTASLIVGG